MSACVDIDKNLFVWGTLTSEKEQSVQIEKPELLPNFQVSSVDVGRSIIAAIDHPSQRLKQINCNDN